MRFLVIAVVVSCSGSQPGTRADDGDAARIVCEAECHHREGCHHDKPACMSRCATLPVRSPPVWSAAWAREVGACVTSASCDHDSEEACVFSTTRHTPAADACTSADAGRKICPVLNGLTPAASDRVLACYQGGGGDSCTPPLDWK